MIFPSDSSRFVASPGVLSGVLSRSLPGPPHADGKAGNYHPLPDPLRLPVREAMEIFSHYSDYDGVNELRSALYRRDWTALKAIFG